MKKIKLDNFNLFLIINGLLCLLFAIIFKPIVFEAMGDAPAYIELAKQIFHLPGASQLDLSYRSPLYSIIIGIVMMIFGQNHFALPVIALQYIMVFFTGWFIYKIVFIITKSSKLAFISGIASTINLSTIYFAYLIGTETLALFLFTFITLQTLKYFKEKKVQFLFFAGLGSGLLVLSRFNAIGIPLVAILIMIFFIVIHFKVKDLKKHLYHLLVLSIPIIVILNAWAFYNFVNNGFYNVIPVQHTGQRWAIPATINHNNKVSEQYTKVLDIYLKNVDKLKLNKKESVVRKGSLLDNPVISRIDDFFKPGINGFYLYKMSEKELLIHYNLPDNSDGINQLGLKLTPFYKEIAVQNSSELFKLKIYSFLYSFKSISPVLPGNDNINLNKLPAKMFIIYKIGLIFIMFIVFAISIIHIIKIFVTKNIKNNFFWIAVYGLIWYFPLVNFYANVMNDANRFRYPIESVILGLFLIVLAKFFSVLKKKYSFQSK